MVMKINMSIMIYESVTLGPGFQGQQGKGVYGHIMGHTAFGLL